MMNSINSIKISCENISSREKLKANVGLIECDSIPFECVLICSRHARHILSAL